MRTTTSLIIALSFVAAAPAIAQGTGNTADPAMTATDPAMNATTDINATGTADPMLTAPTNGLTAGPGAAPATADPMAVDTAYGEAAEREDDDGFPWGVLGLLGLAGLIPRKKRDDTVSRDRAS